MKICLSGASGVIGAGVLKVLSDVVHAAAGSDAVVHVGADGAWDAIEATRLANVKRFVLVSPDPDASELVRRTELDWTIVRPAIVYGPDDAVVTKLLKMVRVLPVIPMIGSDRELQPIWYEDLGRVIAAVIARNDLSKQILDANGPEITTMSDLVRRLSEITGRSPLRVPLPAPLPVSEPERGTNAIALLGIETTPLDRGLRILADALPEQLPHEGVGPLEHKRFYADINGSRYSAAALMMLFRERVNDFMPLEFEAEPGVPGRIEEGATLTGAMPLRGHFQVRVVVAEPRRVVFATVEGHPLAGIVEFHSSDTPTGVRFTIENYARGANVLDMLVELTVGDPGQSAHWRRVVDRVIAASGGTSSGVQEEKRYLRGEEAKPFEERARRLVKERRNALTAAQ